MSADKAAAPSAGGERPRSRDGGPLAAAPSSLGAIGDRDLAAAAGKVLSDCLRVRPGEKVLILSDREYAPFAKKLLMRAKRMSGEATLRALQRLRRKEPSPAIGRLMSESDVVISVARYSLTHSKARRAACRAGARMATMPGVPPASFLLGGLRADYRRVSEVVEAAFRALRGRLDFEVSSENGTRMRLETVPSRSWVRESGLVHHPGEFDNLPAGELAMLPIRERAEGTLVFDFLSGCKGPVALDIRRGSIRAVRGDPAAGRLFQRFGRRSARLAEFALGCNPWARVMENTLECEKALGTCHFAFGNDLIFGGSNAVPFHRDGIIFRPTIRCGGELVVRNGRWCGALGRALRSARGPGDPARAGL